MIVNIDGMSYTFTPIKDFRQAHDLPPDFGITSFVAKDYTDLGRIDRAGSELNSVREAVLAVLPKPIPPAQWLLFLPSLTSLFQNQLGSINAQVGLKAVEIEYAVGGFNDVCQAFAYALVRAHTARLPTPDFRDVYTDWLNGTVKVFAGDYPYAHQGQQWTVQIVAHAYGRMGLLVHIGETRHAVYDPMLACPAAGFMTALLTDIAARMAAI